MFSENQAWDEGLKSNGGKVAAKGNPFDAGKRVFYEVEQKNI